MIASKERCSVFRVYQDGDEGHERDAPFAQLVLARGLCRSGGEQLLATVEADSEKTVECKKETCTFSSVGRATDS